VASSSGAEKSTIGRFKVIKPILVRGGGANCTRNMVEAFYGISQGMISLGPGNGLHTKFGPKARRFKPGLTANSPSIWSGAAKTPTEVSTSNDVARAPAFPYSIGKLLRARKIREVKTQIPEGIDDLWDAIESHRKHLESTGELEHKRRQRILREVEDMVSVRLRERVADLLERGALEELADDLAAKRVDPYRATAMLMERVEPEGRP
jgi:hypothetical protein